MIALFIKEDDEIDSFCDTSIKQIDEDIDALRRLLLSLKSRWAQEDQNVLAEMMTRGRRIAVDNKPYREPKRQKTAIDAMRLLESFNK